ncbi:MAG: hypothetical protein NC037_02425 [Bacteroides sp.]|nr:hypothetical protein [Bacillota bacterium]MCM1455370.1 hypothetical protein [Bacteroides sp.]
MINTIYNLVGEILENAQYIEWNLALIVCRAQNTNADNLFEDMQSMTMGQIKGYAERTNLFDKQDIEELEYILDKRNYLAHHFFKKNDIVKHKNNMNFLKNKIAELHNILLRFQGFNNELSNL